MHTLAVAQAANGQFEQAAEFETEAIAKTSALQMSSRIDYQNYLALFEARRAFPEPGKEELISSYIELAYYQAAGLPEFRDSDQAIGNAEKACSLSNNKNVDALGALAAARASAGDFTVASELMASALILAQKQGGFDLESMKLALSAYENGETWDFERYLKNPDEPHAPWAFLPGPTYAE
jgi:hypothetical protein